MTEVNASLPVIPLNVNGLYFPIRKQRLGEWVFKKHDPTIYFHKDLF
jgi:hypothetical protein